jgi:hypothetical protein
MPIFGFPFGGGLGSFGGFTGFGSILGPMNGIPPIIDNNQLL